MQSLKKIDINKVAAAIEADAGHALSGLRESLTQARAGDFSRHDTRLFSERNAQGGESLPSPKASVEESEDRHGR